ncbi:MAG: hypothetical protein OEM21_09785 [Nitrosopumilus sp.]|nr:hypothetical protein [Nitrosopumilus sp.]
MSVEGKIKDCEFYLKQIEKFNPDPHYTDYFVRAYLKSIIYVYDKIFEEASRDFGLFISGYCTMEKFEQKAFEKNDQLALKFLSWFKKNFKSQHASLYPDFIKKLIWFIKKNKQLPTIVIKICPNQIYQKDIFQSIHVGLAEGKIRSKEELKIEIKRQTPLFLEIINQKRKENNEPKVYENQVLVSSFLEIKNYDDVKILDACKIYLPILIQILEDSRDKIKILTSWIDK